MTIGLYLDKIHKSNILDNDELFKQLKSCSKKDRPDIVQSIFLNNVSSINVVIHRMFGSRLPNVLNDFRLQYDDVFSIGCEALLSSIESFDPELGFKFSSYSFASIRRCISKFFSRIRNLSPSDVSVDKNYAEVDSGGEEYTLMDLVSVQLHTPMEDGVLNRNYIQFILNELRESSSDRDYMIFSTWLHEEKTQKEVGEAFGVTQTYVSKVVKRVQKKARKIREVVES